MSKCYRKNGANRLAQRRVATNLQFVKNTVSAKHIKTKCNKMRYACIYALCFLYLTFGHLVLTDSRMGEKICGKNILKGYPRLTLTWEEDIRIPW